MTRIPDNPLLEVRDVVKTFPGVRALDRVCFDLRPGEVHALVGENGAGKSTLMHILGGVYEPDSGKVYLDGHPMKLPDPHSAAQQGIGVVYQELSLSENLSIAENIFAHRQPANRLGLIDWGELYTTTINLLELFEWAADPRTLVRDLPAAKQQVVEVLKAMSQQPRVLVLDEPTSSLGSAEVKLLFANIRRLKAQGMSFIYISHHLSEVFEIADRVTVLRDGRRVGTWDVAGVTEDDLVRGMVGRELSDVYGTRTSPIGDELLRLEAFTQPGVFADVSFVVREGEVLGVSGLAGAGRTELARAIFGIERPSSGDIYVEGKRVRVDCPADAIANGIAYLSEDRKDDGLFLDMTIRENCAAPSLGRFTGRSGLIDEDAMSDFAAEYRDRFHIATPSVNQQVGLLSGGNQQKVLLAMWVGTHPRVLIADEPTRGVDVGARSEIYHLLRELAARGVAIILISSDLPEVMGLSDRILVMRDGRLVGEFERRTATEESIIACASGLASAIVGAVPEVDR